MGDQTEELLREIAAKHGIAVARDDLAQIRRGGVDRAAFDAGFGQHAFALQGVFGAGHIAPMRDHRLQWRTGVFR